MVGAAALLAGGTACNDYAMFRVAGFAQESFTNDAEVIFVIDNSASMQEETLGLANNFRSFVDLLTNPASGGQTTDGLPDLVENYKAQLENREGYVDFQLAITTTDVESTYGSLYGDPPIIDNAADDIADGFLKNLLCEAACFPGDSGIPSDPTYTCGSPAEEVTTQYLDCLCGVDAWIGHCGSGAEEGIEAVYMAMCRAAEVPPEDCFDEQNQFTQADVGSNGGLIREGATVIPVVVTDEGDVSRRLTNGDADVDLYQNLFAQFGSRMAWLVVGPDPEDNTCTELAVTWGALRYQSLVEDSSGRFYPIADQSSGDCEVSDFAEALRGLGELMNRLLDRFQLSSTPDPASILVYVEGKKVREAAQAGDGSYSDGWYYDANDNAVVFVGEAIPDYDQTVRIYYLPIAGMPRDLPF